MKPTQEQVLDWANQVWGTDLSKPWSQSALLHITELAAIAYEAGRKDENEAFEKEINKEDLESLEDEAYCILVALLAWVRARREHG